MSSELSATVIYVKEVGTVKFQAAIGCRVLIWKGKNVLNYSWIHLLDSYIPSNALLSVLLI